jgi:hypothetical protein
VFYLKRFEWLRKRSATALASRRKSAMRFRLEKRQFIDRVRDRRELRKVFIRVRPHSLEPPLPKYEGMGKAYMSLAERYDNKGLELICDYLERASEVSKRELANMIAANGSRSTQLKSTPCSAVERAPSDRSLSGRAWCAGLISLIPAIRRKGKP